ncbi:MAG: aldehyde dehydrogenase family protein [Phycisphaerales bacterium]
MAPTTRIPVLKTYKLFIDGAFPRSESGRSLEVKDAKGRLLAHLCKASRKDFRDAVEAARRGHEKWAAATAYNRAQVLYRLAEMMEGKRAELAEAIACVGVAPKSAAQEVEVAVDRVVHYAGWADKYAQVLGCSNPVSGPFHNFTVCEPCGVVACIAPDERPLLGLLSVMLPVVASGNACIAVASGLNPIPAAVLAEGIATSDLPAGVINILTGERAELLPVMSGHREVDAIHAALSTDAEITLLREGMAENVKRVHIRRGAATGKAASKRAGQGVDWLDAAACEGLDWIEPFVEHKTLWHPSAV